MENDFNTFRQIILFHKGFTTGSHLSHIKHIVSQPIYYLHLCVYNDQ